MDTELKSFRVRQFPVYLEIRNFIKEIYQLSSTFPKQEQFELASQLRRASTSILLNLIEGSAKKSDAEFNRFVLISAGSATEIIAILDIALDQSYITQEIHTKIFSKVENIVKQLYGFSRRLKG